MKLEAWCFFFFFALHKYGLSEKKNYQIKRPDFLLWLPSSAFRLGACEFGVNVAWKAE